MVAQSDSNSITRPFAWHIARHANGEMQHSTIQYHAPEPEILKNLRHHYAVVVTELHTGVQPDVLTALKRLIAVDDAHSTLHAPDGDDIARMVEHAEAHEYARSVLAAIEAVKVQP